MENKHKFNIPPKCFGQAGPSTGRINTLETRYIGTSYIDFGIYVDTVTLFNRPADLRKYFFMLNYFHFVFYLFSLIVVRPGRTLWEEYST